MRLRHARAACAVVLFAFFGAAHAADTNCPQLFVGGQAPDLIDTSLNERATPLCFQAFAIVASGVTKGPLYSAEHLTASQIAQAGTISRKDAFHAETGIPVADRSQLADYKNSGYDRGHMTPAGDEPDATSQKESFSLANMIPQSHVLNTGKWERIETTVRNMATSDGDIYVVTGPAFDGPTPDTIGADDVIVPNYTWKAVYDAKAGGAGAWRCSNIDVPVCEVVSVTTIINETGIDPFPTLADSVKAKAISLTLPK
ncbi:endonuclease G [Luteibacter sp. Sphag1AF]|uniref:DNA/RNA non-specific endonuclease n=1 Tax=Luteibacter sp. Sphag1AF TaxID=2587031 RepID=UPI00160827EB|nr:DNA/RNA non-specific endonuclease [Luteibacter sp. Sphag1AF]MBB3228266.1 endonuclease G [Luteibacter sp. Sphag1AF]